MILKSRLLTTAFIVPFTVSAALAPVQAFDIRDTDADAPRSTPVDTSTTTGELNTDDAHELASTATIEIDGTPQSNSGAAVLVNSNGQDVLINGVITIRDRDDDGDPTAISLGDAYGVRVTPNLPSGITLRLGTSTNIIINEVRGPDYDGDDDGTLPDNNDSDEDGIIEGSPALSSSDGHTRIGLWIEGAITEDVIGEGGSIRVDGNNARGVQIDGALTGNFDFSTALNATNGGILGDNAIGVDINNTIGGYYRQRGDIDVRGEGGVGIDIDGAISGALMIEGLVNATGYSTIPNGTTGGPTHGGEDRDDTNEFDATRRAANPNERRRGGSAVDIGADITQGVLINGTQNTVVTKAENDSLTTIRDRRSDDDNDNDNVTALKTDPHHYDENRARGRITSYGEADGEAALKITASLGTANGGTRETFLDTTDDDDDDTAASADDAEDVYDSTKEFFYSHGLMNRGGIEANALYDAVKSGTYVIENKATALLIDDNGGGKTIHGGIYNSGTMSAAGYNSNAIAVDMRDIELTDGARSDGSIFLNEGSVTARLDTHEKSYEGIEADSRSAIAVKIGSGVNFDVAENAEPVFTNAGAVSAISIHRQDSGETNDDGDIIYEAVSGQNAIAFDLSEIAGDFNLTQQMRGDYALVNPNAANSSTNPYRGGGDLDIDRAGDIGQDDDDNDINVGDDKIDTRDVTAPFIVGDVNFGDGANDFTVTAGSVTGDINFGAGDDRLLLGNSMADDENDASDEEDDYTAPITTFQGRITNSGTLNITVGGQFNSGETQIDGEKTRLHFSGQEAVNGATPLAVNTLTLKENADLRFDINPDDIQNDTAILDVASFTMGDDATITPLLSNLSGSATTEVKLFEYSTLTLNGDISDYLSGETPFIYNLTLDNNEADGIISATFARKSADDLGLNRTEAAAFDAVIAHFSSNDALGNAMLDLMNKTDFTAAYEQIFPHYSDGTAQQLSGLADMATGAVSQHLQIVKAGGRRGGDGWLQQFGDYRKQDTSSNGQTVSGNNYAIALGYDLPVFAIDALGLYMQIGFSSVNEKSTSLNNVESESISYGAYLSDTIGPLQYQLNAAYGFVDLESERLINFNGIGTASNNPVIADWEATSTAASARLAYPIFEDDYVLRLEAGVDYFRLEHDDYAERQRGFDNGLAMRIAGGESEKTSQFIGLRGGYRAGEGSDGIGIIFKPNYYLGWRSNSDTSPYSATANFIGTEDNTFELKSHIEPEDAFDLGLGFAAHNDYFAFEFNYRARIADDEETHGGGISIRLLF